MKIEHIAMYVQGLRLFLALMPFVAYPDYVSVYLLWHWQGNLDNNNYFLEKYLVRFFIISMYFYIFAQYLSDIVEL